MTEDRDWWEKLIRERLAKDGTVSLDDLAADEMGVPEGLLEAVERLKEEERITVRNEDGERIIAASDG